ncbi:DUF1992 domain-containing protein [Desulfarculales bacterium]
MPILAWTKLAEKRIKDAIERGELDNLPGAGRPLELEGDDSCLHPELRMAYKVLKNAGFTPPELDVRNEIVQMEDMLARAPDEKARYQAIRRLNFLTMKLEVLRPQSALLEEHRYAGKILDRLDKKKNKPGDG